MDEKIERYDSLDGLRVLAMFGVLVMHVLANAPYRSSLAWLYRYIVYFGDFATLFMAISAFSVSCGYYERIKNGRFQEIVHFYKRRYSKLLPFFICLTLLDVVLAPSVESLCEGVANSTLLFGLLPQQQITVIGVGWTLGVIFVFYLLYPFFIFCMTDKFRFLLFYSASVFFAFISSQYFGLVKVDFLACLVYFTTGCGIYLWRKEICKIKHWVLVLLTIVTMCLFFVEVWYRNIFSYMFITSLLLLAVNISGTTNILSCKVLSRISKYSFEVYLSHMVAYRVLEKCGLLKIFDNALLSYVVSCVIVFTLSFAIAFAFQYFWKWASTIWQKRRFCHGGSL